MSDYISAFDYKNGSKKRLVLSVLNELFTSNYLSIYDCALLKHQAVYEGKAEEWFEDLKHIYAEEYPSLYESYYSN